MKGFGPEWKKRDRTSDVLSRVPVRLPCEGGGYTGVNACNTRRVYNGEMSGLPESVPLLRSDRVLPHTRLDKVSR